MDWGLKNRLSKIIKPDTGRSVMLALDHGYFLGPISKLEDPLKAIEPLIPYADSLMLTRGVLRNCFDPTVNTPVVLRVSGGTSVVGSDLSNEGLTTSVEEAIRLNVSAMALSIFVGTDHEQFQVVLAARQVGGQTIHRRRCFDHLVPRQIARQETISQLGFPIGLPIGLVLAARGHVGH